MILLNFPCYVLHDSYLFFSLSLFLFIIISYTYPVLAAAPDISHLSSPSFYMVFSHYYTYKVLIFAFTIPLNTFHGIPLILPTYYYTINISRVIVHFVVVGSQFPAYYLLICLFFLSFLFQLPVLAAALDNFLRPHYFIYVELVVLHNLQFPTNL